MSDRRKFWILLGILMLSLLLLAYANSQLSNVTVG